MSSLGAFREAVQAELAEDLGVRFKGGKIDGPVTENDLGCCWSEGKAEVSGRVDEEQLFVRARIFLRFKPREGPEDVTDSRPLEDLAEKVQLAIRDKQTTLGPWYCRVTEVETNIDLQYVEAQIVGWQDNRGL